MVKIELVPVGVVFTYNINEKNKQRKNRLYWKLYGVNLQSNFGRYTYRKRGLLDDITYLKPTHSTLIVRHESARLLRTFFKKHKINFTESIIILQEDQAKTLGLLYPHRWQHIVDDLKNSPKVLVSVEY